MSKENMRIIGGGQVTDAHIESSKNWDEKSRKDLEFTMLLGRIEMRARMESRSKGRGLLCKIGIHLPRMTAIGLVCARCQKFLK